MALPPEVPLGAACSVGAVPGAITGQQGDELPVSGSIMVIKAFRSLAFTILGKPFQGRKKCTFEKFLQLGFLKHKFVRVNFIPKNPPGFATQKFNTFLFTTCSCHPCGGFIFFLTI